MEGIILGIQKPNSSAHIREIVKMKVEVGQFNLPEKASSTPSGEIVRAQCEKGCEICKPPFSRRKVATDSAAALAKTGLSLEPVDYPNKEIKFLRQRANLL